MNIEIPDMKKISASIEKNIDEGYVYNSYGSELYLKHVISSIVTLRRYDQKRPVALFCSKNHPEDDFRHRTPSIERHYRVHPPEVFQSCRALI